MDAKKAYKQGDLLIVQTHPFACELVPPKMIYQLPESSKFAYGKIMYPRLQDENSWAVTRDHFGAGLIPQGNLVHLSKSYNPFDRESEPLNRAACHHLDGGTLLFFSDFHMDFEPFGLLHLTEDTQLTHPAFQPVTLPPGYYELRKPRSEHGPINGCQIWSIPGSGSGSLSASSWDTDFTYELYVAWSPRHCEISFYYWHSYLFFEAEEFEGKNEFRMQLHFSEGENQPGEAGTEQISDWEVLKERLITEIDGRSYTNNFGISLFYLIRTLHGKLSPDECAQVLKQVQVFELKNLIARQYGTGRFLNDLPATLIDEDQQGAVFDFLPNRKLYLLKSDPERIYVTYQDTPLTAEMAFAGAYDVNKDYWTSIEKKF